MRDADIGFVPSREFDLGDKADRAAYTEEWRAALRAAGFRMDEEFEKDAEGHTTAAGLAHMTDVWTHNVSIQLRMSVDKLEKGSEAEYIVHDLWHTIMATASSFHHIAQHLAEKEAAS